MLGKKGMVPFPGAVNWSTAPDEAIPCVPYDTGSMAALRAARTSSGPFVVGKLSLDWVRLCWEAHPAALPLALAIRARSRIHKGAGVPVGDALGRRVGLSPDRRRRALLALEAAGLVRIERRVGRVTLATLVDGPPKP